MVRAGSLYRTHGSANYKRNRNRSVRDMPYFACLVDDLAHRFGQEIGEHEVDDRMHSSERSADGGAREAELRDRCVDEPIRAKLVPKALRMSEAAAALACPLPQQDNALILAHLRGDGVSHGLDITDLRHGRTRAPP